MPDAPFQFQLLTRRPATFRASRVESLIQRKTRRMILTSFTLLTIVFLILANVRLLSGFSRPVQLALIPLILMQYKFLGFFLISFCVLLLFVLLEFYFLSNARPVPFLVATKENGGEVTYALDFGGARRFLWLGGLEQESVSLAALYAFFKKSNFVPLLLLRLGISFKEFEGFFTGSKDPLTISQNDLFAGLAKEADETKSNVFGAREFSLLLFDRDKNLEAFFFDRKIRRQEFSGAADWAARVLESVRLGERWWERSALGKTPGIGMSSAFGYTYHLDQFARDISDTGGHGLAYIAHAREIKLMEETLSREAQSNVLLIGEAGVGRHAILSGFARLVYRGATLPILAYKRIVSLDTVSLVAHAKTKGNLEGMLIAMLNEAAVAGNIILVIDKFAEFLESSRLVGVDAMDVLGTYLEASAFELVAISDTATFQKILSQDPRIGKLFGVVEAREPSLEETTLILEDAAPYFEARGRTLITYQAVEKIASLADRFITEGVMPEKALDLLDKMAAHAVSEKISVIRKEDIEKLVETETRIPTSAAAGKEAERLLHLEELFHKRLVGQEEAIRAIADALRRVRSGLHGSQRPIGSFLFLGPTGVGKTETAKTLAEVYFGSEKTMTRFDMSEYQGWDGITKLIGSLATNTPGALSQALHSQPFGLLLFDEFEKSSKDVLNIFLQILDEGFFTDGFGKRVSCRETIIIATSNAGSELIWELVQKGVDPAALKKEVVDEILKQGVFSPELVNRFDETIVYHPLGKEELKNIARLLLEDLSLRLKVQDIDLVRIESLAQKVADIGYEPTMGARPMRRAINDRVEGVIAKKILEGKVPRGGTIEFTPDELAAL